MARKTNETSEGFPLEKIDDHTVRLRTKKTIEIEDDEIVSLTDMKSNIQSIEKAIDDTLRSRGEAIKRFDATIAVLTGQKDRMLDAITQAQALGVEEVKGAA